MARLIEFLTATQEKVFVEVLIPDDIQPMAADGSDLIQKASQTFESAMASVRHAASALVESAGKLSLPADTIEMELGVKASAKAGFYLASADSEAQIKVKLIWHKKGTVDSKG